MFSASDHITPAWNEELMGLEWHPNGNPWAKFGNMGKIPQPNLSETPASLEEMSSVVTKDISKEKLPFLFFFFLKNTFYIIYVNTSGSWVKDFTHIAL